MGEGSGTVGSFAVEGSAKVDVQAFLDTGFCVLRAAVSSEVMLTGRRQRAFGWECYRCEAVVLNPWRDPTDQPG